MRCRPAFIFVLLILAAPLWAGISVAKNTRSKVKALKTAPVKVAAESKNSDTANVGSALSPAVSQDDAEDKNAPLKITSQRMVSEKKANKISFYGSVVAIKGKLQVQADEIHIFTDETQKHLKEMEAVGSVVIIHKDKRATGKKAVYYDDTQTLVLTGDPVLTQNNNVASGEKVIYRFGLEDMEIISGESQPATITLFPGEAGK